MSRKTLNKTNLQKQGAEMLADLVMDLVQGSATLQPRARMELSAAEGPKQVASDLRKRFASLRRTTGFVDWRKQKELVKDLDGLLQMIESRIAPYDPGQAFVCSGRSSCWRPRFSSARMTITVRSAM